MTAAAVHPHARGEHFPGTHARRPSPGSSPRPWGTLMSHADFFPKCRFIPTPVGNTEYPMLSSIVAAVHPHARGEHQSRIREGTASYGSSPRPWGTLLCRPMRVLSCRFIPTPVGNTREREKTATWMTVHPHARGEHRMVWTMFSGHFGSSPRPWGTRPAHPFNSSKPRFIPTPVGNTMTLIEGSESRSVHPHARGEHAKRNR